MGRITISSEKSSLNPEDAAALYIELGWGTERQYSPARMKRSLENCDIVIFALNDGGELVGLLRALTDRTIDTKILDLVVAPEYQRQGIGRKMMRALAVAAKGTTVYFETERRNFGFAERCGYVKRKGLTVFKKTGKG